jgi:hypothetical protein
MTTAVQNRPTLTLDIHLPTPHPHQRAFIKSKAKRKVVKAGRRGGKTVGIAIYAVEKFLEGRRVLYTAPTTDQVAMFWRTVCKALAAPIEAKVFRKDETLHIIERVGTEQRIRAKTAWNSDSLRGDYADELIFDEWQLMNEGAWKEVGAPMLLDNNGNAVFIYTPPSLHSRSVSKADDPQHAAKLFKRALLDDTGRWDTFHFRSMDNPHISKAALAEIAGDMTALAYRMEIEAEDVDEAPGALWTRETIETGRVLKAPDLSRVVIAVDPSATAGGDEAGIIGAGCVGTGKDLHAYILEDASVQGSPQVWAKAAVTLYHKLGADKIVAEGNNGGEMITQVIKQVDSSVRVKLVHASRGKATRAEPVAAVYEQGRAHHVGKFSRLEDEQCLWMPGDTSPNRMDALVWALTELVVNAKRVGGVL